MSNHLKASTTLQRQNKQKLKLPKIEYFVYNYSREIYYLDNKRFVEFTPHMNTTSEINASETNQPTTWFKESSIKRLKRVKMLKASHSKTKV